VKLEHEPVSSSFNLHRQKEGNQKILISKNLNKNFIMHVNEENGLKETTGKTDMRVLVRY